MKLRVLQSIQDLSYVFVFSIDPESITDDDNQRIKKFGAPSIDFGGTFDNDAGLTFTLPDEYYTLPFDFPVKKTFSLVAPFDTDAINKFTLYRTTIVGNVTTAITNLRNQADTFTGEFVSNI